MDDEMKVKLQAAVYTAGIWAVLIGLFMMLTGCTPDARAAPPAPDATAVLQQATDSTAVLTVSWGAVDPPADLWRWDVAEAGEAGEQTGRTLELEIDRRDSTYAETACVRGVAQRGDEEAVGEEGCASVEVPPTPLEAPGTPDVDASVDTAQTALFLDSARVYDLARLALQPDTGYAVSDSLRTILLAYEGGEPHLCAGVSGQWGWWPAVLSSTELPQVRRGTVEMWPDADCEYMTDGETRVAARVRGQIVSREVRHATDTVRALATRTWTAATTDNAVSVSNLSPASYETATMQVGALLYIDRTYEVTSLPAEIEGGTLIRTANDDVGVTGDLLSFSTGGLADVWIAWDARSDSLPAWMDGWSDTGLTVETTDTDYRLYRAVREGEVTLGGADLTSLQSNYWVVVTTSSGALALLDVGGS